MSVLSASYPRGAVPGARLELTGSRLPQPPDGPPRVWFGALEARVAASSSRSLTVIVPPECAGGPTAVRVDGVEGETLMVDVARPLGMDLHLVDNPLCLPDGTIWGTHSGTRENKSSTPLSRFSPEGAREDLGVEIANPTSLALGPDDAVYVSSRFEGAVYRVTDRGAVDTYATDLGVATGLAFAQDGALFVGDRSGTVLRISPAVDESGRRSVETFASLPPSVAAFHLAMAPDGWLYVSAPTLASRDVIYRISPEREVQTWCASFGRPQGMAFDRHGTLFVVEGLAGSSGLYRVDPAAAHPEPELIVSAPQLVGVAVHPTGELVLASSDALWRL
ncbi:MAG: gluconolaconase [Vicinamibacterales bacterium]